MNNTHTYQIKIKYQRKDACGNVRFNICTKKKKVEYTNHSPIHYLKQSFF